SPLLCRCPARNLGFRAAFAAHGIYLISAGCSDLARRLSRPALECMRECAHRMEAEQPRVFERAALGRRGNDPLSRAAVERAANNYITCRVNSVVRWRSRPQHQKLNLALHGVKSFSRRMASSR